MRNPLKLVKTPKFPAISLLTPDTSAASELRKFHDVLDLLEVYGGEQQSGGVRKLHLCRALVEVPLQPLSPPLGVRRPRKESSERKSGG